MRDTVSASNEGEGAECRLALFFSSLLGLQWRDGNRCAVSGDLSRKGF